MKIVEFSRKVQRNIHQHIDCIKALGMVVSCKQPTLKIGKRSSETELLRILMCRCQEEEEALEMEFRKERRNNFNMATKYLWYSLKK